MRTALPLLVLVVAALPPAAAQGDDAAAPLASPRGEPEYGHGLTADDADAGWISLFDGASTFGWTAEATAKDDAISGGATTTEFGDMEVMADVAKGGTITLGGGHRIEAPEGKLKTSVQGAGRGPIRLTDGATVRSIAVRPLGLKDVTPGKDLAGWKIIRRQGDRPVARWTVDDDEGTLRAAGGPEAVELQERYGDLVLQVQVRTNSPMANGGVFFRCIPGDFMNGYEAQIYNAGRGGDPGKPAEYTTGAIDDRQSAPRVVSRDGRWFTMTVVATGPHLATWVNGRQLTEWTDPRDRHENPRRGLRLEPGTVQLQAHDPKTDIEFRRIRIGQPR